MRKQKSKNGFRICFRCKINKPYTSEFFHESVNIPGRLSYRCIECEKLVKCTKSGRYKGFTEEQRKRRFNYTKNYFQTEKGKAIHILSSYKVEDKRKGREYNMTIEDMIEVLKSSCVYCGFPATGVDRIDNKKGHITGNYVPACKECNVSRMNDFTHEEMFIIGKAVKEVKEKRLSIFRV